MILLLLLLLAMPAQAQPRSGYADSGPTVRAMQDDDSANPAFFAVQQGESLWQSCARCHGDVAGMKGVAAAYPKFNASLGRPVTLTQQINRCRARDAAAPLGPDDDDMLALTALIGLQSRGLPVAVDTSGPAQPAYAQGDALFNLRQGQLNLACATCHDTLAGRRLGGALIPQGHANAYPIYRLEWQAVGSLTRRLRQCFAGQRAEMPAPDSAELAALEFFLAARDAGLKVETPGVRP
jgi:sulfur-oxidizing protein SoxA